MTTGRTCGLPPFPLSWGRLACLLIWLLSSRTNTAAALHHVARLAGSQPVISVEQFTAAGISNDAANINGPSVIRIPDWIGPADRADPGAVYYMYFASHAGKYIRMAWASYIEGPWSLFNVGVYDDPRVPMKGVLDLGSDSLISFGAGQVEVRNHIASPDVKVDDTNRRFIMYFHGESNGRSGATGTQKTFVATSTNGLNFNIPADGGQTGHGVRNVILGNAYFRVFGHGTNLFAFSNFGAIWRAPNADNPWQAPANPLDDAWIEGPNPVYADLQAIRLTDPSRPLVDTPRHFAARMLPDGDTLEVLYTARGEAPERIFRTTLSLAPDWLAWNSENLHRELLRPELDWEGADQPLAPSQNGAQVNVNQLRDPCLFVDTNGTHYLFYSGEGEEAIGIARMNLDRTALDFTAMPSIPGPVLLWNEYPGLRFRVRQTSDLSISPTNWPLLLDRYGSVEQRVVYPLPSPTAEAAVFFILEAND